MNGAAGAAADYPCANSASVYGIENSARRKSEQTNWKLNGGRAYGSVIHAAATSTSSAQTKEWYGHTASSDSIGKTGGVHR